MGDSDQAVLHLAPELVAESKPDILGRTRSCLCPGGLDLSLVDHFPDVCSKFSRGRSPDPQFLFSGGYLFEGNQYHRAIRLRNPQGIRRELRHFLK